MMSSTTNSARPEITGARVYGGVAAEDRRTQRRQRFVEAGIEVFGTRGLSRSTIRDLCAEAKLTDRYFYESFRSVEDVFEAAYLELTEHLVQRLIGAMSRVPMRMETLAEAGLRSFFSFLHEDPRRARILLIDSLGLYFSAPRNNNVRIDAYVGMLVQLYGTLYPKASGLDVNIGYVAKCLIGMTLHGGAVWAQDGFDKSVDEVVRHHLFAWRGFDAWVRQALPQPEEAALPDASSPLI